MHSSWVFPRITSKITMVIQGKHPNLFLLLSTKHFIRTYFSQNEIYGQVEETIRAHGVSYEKNLECKIGLLGSSTCSWRSVEFHCQIIYNGMEKSHLRDCLLKPVLFSHPWLAGASNDLCIGKTYVSVSQNFPDEHLLLQIRWAFQPMWSKYFALQFLFNSVPCPDDSQKRHIFFNEPLESKVNRIQITTSIILLTHLVLQRPVLKRACPWLEQAHLSEGVTAVWQADHLSLRRRMPCFLSCTHARICRLIS